MEDKEHGEESRFDFQQMLKELEQEGGQPLLKDVRQGDITELFKKKGDAGQGGPSR
jgi:hypothetical protein